MLFTLTDEQTMVAETARALFAEHAAQLRTTIEREAAYDRDAWRAVVAEMGFGSIAVPQSLGGAGLGHVELALIMIEMGRTLFPSPFLPSICMAVPAILAAGSTDQQARLLAPVMSGESIATLARVGPGGRAIEARIEAKGADFVLDGAAGFVPFGHAADLFVVACTGPGDGISLVALDAGASGSTVERHVTLDMTRPFSTLRFECVAVARDAVLGAPGAAAPALDRALDLARIALAAECVGGAEAVLDMTVDYAKQRIQFGRPIGSFQAVKHRLADMMIEVESARTAVYYAAAVADERQDELCEAAAIAASACADAFTMCAGNAIQLHGGIGFTWEHDAHLYFKRARSAATLLGTPAEARERLAATIGLNDAR